MFIKNQFIPIKNLRDTPIIKFKPVVSIQKIFVYTEEDEITIKAHDYNEYLNIIKWCRKNLR